MSATCTYTTPCAHCRRPVPQFGPLMNFYAVTMCADCESREEKEEKKSMSRKLTYESGEIVDRDNELIAMVVEHEYGPLLAAAPDLLAALENFVNSSMVICDPHLMVEARAAIARAKGGA